MTSYYEPCFCAVMPLLVSIFFVFCRRERPAERACGRRGLSRTRARILMTGDLVCDPVSQRGIVCLAEWRSLIRINANVVRRCWRLPRTPARRPR